MTAKIVLDEVARKHRVASSTDLAAAPAIVEFGSVPTPGASGTEVFSAQFASPPFVTVTERLNNSGGSLGILVRDVRVDGFDWRRTETSLDPSESFDWKAEAK